MINTLGLAKTLKHWPDANAKADQRNEIFRSKDFGTPTEITIVTENELTMKNHKPHQETNERESQTKQTSEQNASLGIKRVITRKF